MTTNDVEPAAAVALSSGWPDLQSRFGFYVVHGECYPFVAELDGAVVGAGVATKNSPVGWLGHIVVSPEHRKRGIGTALTRVLMECLDGLRCRTLVLSATEQGRPIYERLGFTVDGYYHRFKGPAPGVAASEPRLRPIAAGDLPEVCNLDRQATGEDRSHLLRRFGLSGWLTTDHAGRVRGYFVPAVWGEGAVVATSLEVAWLLLGRKAAGGDGTLTATLPTANALGRASLAEAGFAEVRRLPRMILGEPVQWRPAAIWSVFALAFG